MDFCQTLISKKAGDLAVFGDSITVGLNASTPELSWPALLGKAAGVTKIRNHAISGTVLQGSIMADGKPRLDNGVSRFRAALIEGERSDAIAILYGYNDARYIGAPQTMNPDGFRRDYTAILQGLLEAGYDPAIVAIGSPPYPSDRGFSVGSAGFTGQTRAGFERYPAIVRELAATFKVQYAPVYEAMAAHDDGTLSSSDITHPNDLGHQVIARAFEHAGRIA